jgi:chromosome segregation ATPase
MMHESPAALQNEVSEIRFKLNQHVDETRTLFQQIKENFAYQLEQLRESYSLPGKKNAKCYRTSLECENARLRQENAQLKEANNTLKKRFNNYSCTVSDLKTKIENIENEKLSLITAIKLLQDDNNSTLPNNKQSACNTWQVPQFKVHSRPSTREISVNHGQNKR